MNYKNNEGYSDPTAGTAMSNMMKEFRQERKAKWQIEHDAKTRKRVYVASPYAGDIEQNTANAVCYCQYAIQRGYMPVASHLLYPAMLADNDPQQRTLGTMFGLALLNLCHEVWVLGAQLSPGMEREVVEAKRLKKPIRYFDSNLKEVP